MVKMDYKKHYKDLYLPKETPVKIMIPSISFFMVNGKGDPNIEGGEYQQAVEVLYALSYTIKMSPKKNSAPDGYYEYVVPPLEGLWWLEDENDMDFTQKGKFCWTAMIRQPGFVTDDVFQWACGEVKKKKPELDVHKAAFRAFEEGLCVHALHIGPYDDEPRTIEKIEKYINENGFINDIGAVLPDGLVRRHHEIYLSDPRKTKPEKLKTVIRHPVKEA